MRRGAHPRSILLVPRALLQTIGKSCIVAGLALNTKYHTKSGNLNFCPSGPLNGEKEESASHHLFAFAQLRAEMAENDAREARGSPEITKNLNFGTPENSTFIKYF